MGEIGPDPVLLLHWLLVSLMMIPGNNNVRNLEASFTTLYFPIGGFPDTFPGGSEEQVLCDSKNTATRRPALQNWNCIL